MDGCTFSSQFDTDDASKVLLSDEGADGVPSKVMIFRSDGGVEFSVVILKACVNTMVSSRKSPDLSFQNRTALPRQL